MSQNNNEQLIALLQKTKKNFMEKQSPILRKKLDKLLTMTRKRFMEEQESFKRLKRRKRCVIVEEEEEESLTLSPPAMDQLSVPSRPQLSINLTEQEKKISYIDLTQPSSPSSPLPTTPPIMDKTITKSRRLFEPKTPPLPPPEMSNYCPHFPAPPTKFSTKRHLPTAKTKIIRPMAIRPNPKENQPIWRPWRPRAEDYF